MGFLFHLKIEHTFPFEVDFMILKDYKPCGLEEWINTRYIHSGIHTPGDLDPELVAQLFGADVVMYLGPSFADWREGGYSVIFLDRRLSDDERRAVFFHELCHPVRHVGKQTELPQLFAELQEIQAGLFQLYAAMPIYMIEGFAEYLEEAHAVQLLALEFRLPAELVERRLQQIAARLRKGEEEAEMAKGLPAMPTTEIVAHSPETLKLLNKLLWLSAQKGRKVNRGK
jgi:Zn-dependent peptidase ImmA (M78 family)